MKTSSLLLAGAMNCRLAGRGVRWPARGLSLLMIGFLALMFVGEGGPGSFTSPARIWHFLGSVGLRFLFFPVGIVVGLVVAWWRETWGGGIALGSLAAFYGAHWLGTGGSGRVARGFWSLRRRHLSFCCRAG